MGKRTPIGAFIHSSWTNLNIRCGKYKHLQTTEKCKSYENITIEFTREEYKEFCYLNIDIILNLKKPSLDRLDSKLNYSINNIQFIELVDNIQKEKLTFKENIGICRNCKEIKDIELFTKDKRRYVGRSNICKLCDNFRKTKKYERSNIIST